MRVGIFGGTFDPIHNGHMALALAALETINLEEVVFMPAARNPLKHRRTHASDEDRLGMLEVAVRGRPGLAFSDLEIRRGGASYTAETLEELSMAMPAEYWFLMGVDSLRSFSEWKQPQKIVKLARLGVASRPPVNETEILRGVPLEFARAVDIVPMPPHDVSSSQIRERLGRGTHIDGMTPTPVEAYIMKHALYRDV